MHACVTFCATSDTFSPCTQSWKYTYALSYLWCNDIESISWGGVPPATPCRWNPGLFRLVSYLGLMLFVHLCLILHVQIETKTRYQVTLAHFVQKEDLLRQQKFVNTSGCYWNMAAFSLKAALLSAFSSASFFFFSCSALISCSNLALAAT